MNPEDQIQNMNMDDDSFIKDLKKQPDDADAYLLPLTLDLHGSMKKKHNWPRENVSETDLINALEGHRKSRKQSMLDDDSLSSTPKAPLMAQA